jgi:hypothetical protein
MNKIYVWVKKHLYRLDDYAITRDWAMDSGDYEPWKREFRRLLGPNMSEIDKDYLVETNYINFSMAMVKR